MGATIDDDLLLASLQNAIDTGVQDIILLLLGAQTSHRGHVTAWWLAHNIDAVRPSPRGPCCAALISARDASLPTSTRSC
jgi:hypothetical protein